MFELLLASAIALLIMLVLFPSVLLPLTTLRRASRLGVPRLAIACLIALLILSPRLALAATTTARVDISPLVQALVAVAAAVITTLAPYVAYLVTKHLKIANDSLLATRVSTGVNALAQVAVAEAASIGAHNATITVNHPAVQAALTKASAGFVVAQNALGITDATIAQRVAGQVTALLPAVPASAPSTSAT